MRRLVVVVLYSMLLGAAAAAIVYGAVLEQREWQEHPAEWIEGAGGR